MILQTFKISLISLSLGFIFNLMQGWVGSCYLSVFLHENLITLLVALLAINSATMGIVLTKIRDLIEVEKAKSEDEGAKAAACFGLTRANMLQSVKEQISLIVVAVVIFILADSDSLAAIKNFNMLVQSCIIGIFAYSLMILYDTSKGVLIIVDYDSANS